MILPASYTLSGRVLEIDSFPLALGGYWDAREGTLDGSKVYVKSIRVYAQGVAHKVVEVNIRRPSRLVIAN